MKSFRFCLGFLGNGKEFSGKFFCIVFRKIFQTFYNRISISYGLPLMHKKHVENLSPYLCRRDIFISLRRYIYLSNPSS